jgi:flagellar basal body-associated protein FliL
MKKRLIILIVIVAVLAVAILYAVGIIGPKAGDTSATDAANQNAGLVMEDSATVEVDIDKKKSKKNEDE